MVTPGEALVFKVLADAVLALVVTDLGVAAGAAGARAVWLSAASTVKFSGAAGVAACAGGPGLFAAGAAGFSGVAAAPFPL